MSSPTSTPVRRIEPGDVDGSVDVISEHVLDHRAEGRRNVIERAADPTDSTASGVVVADSRVLGCMIYTVHDEQTDLGDIFTRSVPHSVNKPFAAIRYGYLRKEHMGKGYGTKMLTQTVRQLERRGDVDRVFVEAWHRPQTLDMRPLLTKFDFDVVFESDDYWAHEEYDGRHEVCSDCGVPYTDCDCGGSVRRLIF